jgi:alpha-mannosidase
MSWALHNHWMVNFKASQGGQIPLRYRLTTHSGPCDAAAAARFGAEESTPPIVLRDYRRETAAWSGSFADVGDDGVLMTAKPAEDRDGVVLRVRNVRGAGRDVAIAFRDVVPSSVHLTSPVEVDGDELALDGSTVRVPIDGLAVRSLRARF